MTTATRFAATIVRAAAVGTLVLPSSSLPLVGARLTRPTAPRGITICVPGFGWRIYLRDDVLAAGRAGDPFALAVLEHELVHVADARQFTRVGFLIAYFLVLPILLTLRALFEWRGYKAELRSLARSGLLSTPLAQGLAVAAVVGHFCGWRYGWMFPARGYLTRRLAAFVEGVVADVLAPVAAVSDAPR